MHRALVFDLFGTLVNQGEDCFGQIATLLGLQEADLLNRWRTDATARYLGHHSFASSLTRLCYDMSSGLDERSIRMAVRLGLEELNRSLQSVSSTTLFVLQRLVDASVPTGLVSNAWPEVVGFWPRSPVARFFPRPVFSCTVGLAKPNPAIYLLACELLRVSAEECVFVGDGGDQELEGAAAVGMMAVQVSHRLAPIPSAQVHLDSITEVLNLLNLGPGCQELQS